MCVKNGKYTKWLLSNHSQPVYLPKCDRHLAEKLAAKKYYTLQLKELSLQYKLLTQFIQQYSKCKITSSSLLDDTSFYKELLNSHFSSFPDHLNEWITKEFTHNTFHPENLIFRTLDDHYVRSKSEVIIANALYLNHIPYRYECELCINDIKLYPDFTIFHPQKQCIIYWEHFGMMDQSVYRDNAYNKLKIYGTFDILPSINLITTFETKSHPIDSAQIQRTIQEYFL